MVRDKTSAPVKERALRRLQPAAPNVAELAQRAEVLSTCRPQVRGTRAQALDLIFATAVDLGEGMRTGALGAPRFGKTYHLQEIVAEAIARGHVRLALIHDNKRPEAQYRGIVTPRTDLVPPLPPGERAIVFHGGPNYPMPEVEPIALRALALGRQRVACLLLVDELYQALKSGQHWKGPSFGEAVREGSSKLVSTAWTTQAPQCLPRECQDMTETIAIFQLQGRSLSYTIEMLRLPREAASVIPRLQRGEFVLWTNTAGCDLTIYGPH